VRHGELQSQWCHFGGVSCRIWECNSTSSAV
jgi:hypothetical protein